MSNRLVPIRLIWNSDQFGALDPFPTSYGALPGARALEDHVNELREGAHTARWIDGGDFAAGGVIAPVTDHELGWLATAALTVDAGVPGNHDFDLGDDAFERHAAQLPFPLFGLGLPGRDHHLIIESPAGVTVAVIGLAFPERRGRFVYTATADHTAAVEQVATLAAKLRPDVDHIIVAMHEGVASLVHPPTAGPIAELCTALAPHVDAVLAGHTMNRHLGILGGLPYAQPWPLGYEVAVLDIWANRIEPWLSRVPGTKPWHGPGRSLLDKLSADIVGTTRTDLRTPATPGSESLAAAVATGLRRATHADVAFVTVGETGWMQPWIDRTGGYIAAGPVSRAQINRAVPWNVDVDYDHVWLAELSGQQVSHLATALTRALGDTEISAATDQPAGVTAIGSNRIGIARAALGDAVAWSPSDVGLRDGLARWIEEA